MSREWFYSNIDTRYWKGKVMLLMLFWCFE